MRIKFTLVFVFILSMQRLSAQVETVLPFFRSMHQSSFFNPAFVPEYKTSIGLPVLDNIGLGTNINLTGFDLHLLVQSVDENHILDYEKMFKSLDGPIGYNLSLKMDLLYARFRVRSVYVGISTGMRMSQSLGLGKELLGLPTADGLNALKARPGENFDLLKMGVNLYTESAVSFTKEVGRLSFGFRVKVLNGIANIQTDQVHFNIKSNTDTLEMQTSGSAHSSGAPIQADSVDGHVSSNGDKNLQASDFTSFKNLGYGFDFGFTYQASMRLNVHGSVTDFGSFINWKNKTYNYDLSTVLFRFTGVSISQLNDTNQYFAHLQDSIFNIVKKSHVESSSSYKTTLPTRYYAGADYDVTKSNRVGFLFQAIYYQGNVYPSYTISYMHKFGRVWHLMANASKVDDMYKSYNTIGFGSLVKLGCVQFYIMQDNLVAFLDPSPSRTFTMTRIGFNLVFRALPRRKLVIR